MIDRHVVGVRKIVKLGGSLVVSLPENFCKREKIGKGDYFVFMDRGTRLTGTSMKQFNFDESLKMSLRKKEGEK